MAGGEDEDISKTVARLLCEEPIPLGELRRIGTECPGGFQSRALRRRVWPKLLAVDRYEVDAAWGGDAARRFADRLPEDVRDLIGRDVARSLHAYEQEDVARHSA